MGKRVVKLKKGDELFKEGDPSDAMYIIQKGRLAITKNKGKSAITLAELKQGDLLGEMAFFDRAPRSAGAKAALNDTEVIELPFSALQAQYAGLPEWVKAIMKAVNGHLRRANIKIRSLERTKEEEKEVFPSHTITALCYILAFVAKSFGEPIEGKEQELQIPGGKLRTITIQVFQQATHKMQTLIEVLCDLGYMTQENLGEGKQRTIINDLPWLLNFCEFYNNQLFSEQAKKYNISEAQLKTLRVIKHYGVKEEKNTKGFIKLNLTDISNISMKEMGQRMSLADAKTLAEIGLLGDYSSDGEADYIEFDIDYIVEIVPYWELVYTLKAFQTD